MASRSEVEAALAAAKAAGASSDVAVLTKALAEMNSPGPWATAGLHALQGATAGFGDEIQGVFGGLGNLRQGKPFGEGYHEFRDKARHQLDDSARVNTVAATLGDVGGSL